MTFDTKIFEWIHGLAGKNALADNLGIFFANYIPYILFIGFFFILFRTHRGRGRIFFFAQTVLILIVSRGIVTELIQFFWHRARPFMTLGFTPLLTPMSGASFPSGHASFYIALAFAIYFMDRGWGILYIILASLNALARVYVGVHYPADILAVAGIGILSAFLIRGLIRRYVPPEKAVKPLETKEVPPVV